MKTNSSTILEPILMVDSHHGIYSWQIFVSQLNSYLHSQIKADLITDLSSPDNEFYCDAADEVSQMTFKTPSGQKLFIHEYEGDIYLVPACYARTKAGKEFLSY